MINPNRLYIDKLAIKYNLKMIKEKVGKNTLIMPIVKANAYGCGIKEIASIFKDSEYLAVADLKEALELREILPQRNILIIYQPFIEDIKEIVKYSFLPAVSDLDFLIELNKEAENQNKFVRIHIEIDTGMSRFGINETECEVFAKAAKDCANIVVEGLFTHYSSAASLAPDSLEYTKKQTDMFKSIVTKMTNILGPIKYLHASAGAAIFNPCAEIFNMVRPAYILYGYHNNLEFKRFVQLKPALKLVSKIIQINEYDEGTCVGYDRKFISLRKSKIATVAIGYADGIPRSLYQEGNGASFVVKGKRAPIAGTICMDVIMIDITDIGNVKVGDDVYIFDNEIVTLEKLAELSGSIGCEFITRLSPSIQKIIID